METTTATKTKTKQNEKRSDLSSKSQSGMRCLRAFLLLPYSFVLCAVTYFAVTFTFSFTFTFAFTQAPGRTNDLQGFLLASLLFTLFGSLWQLYSFPILSSHVIINCYFLSSLSTMSLHHPGHHHRLKMTIIDQRRRRKLIRERGNGAGMSIYRLPLVLPSIFRQQN